MEKRKASTNFRQNSNFTDNVSPRYNTRSDNAEARQVFSKNFGDFLEKKKAFDFKRPSKFSTTSNQATFRRSPKVSTMENSTLAGTTETSTFLPFAGKDKKDLNIKKPIRVLHLT